MPQSYFVLLTDIADEYFYHAQYGNCNGYVKKKEVTPMNGTPLKPYATSYNLRITSMSGLPIFETPSFNGEQISTVDFLQENINYYGNMQGQEYFPNSTDVWYYCSYTENNQTIYGYVFSYYCNLTTDIKNNKEYFEEITEQLSFQKHISNSTNLSETLKALVILCVVISILIGIYIFTAPQSNKSRRNSRKNRKDYYELNENDLN